MPSSHKHDFLPSREAELRDWSRNFSDQINASAPQFGLTPAQAADYSALNDGYAIAFSVATSPATNSKANVIVKNSAKAALKANARMLARLVRATPGVTNDQRSQLGLRVPDTELTPAPRPADPPVVSILPSMGRIVRIRLRDKAAPMRNGKPPGIAGAVVMSYVAPAQLPPGSPQENEPSARMADWTFHGNATRRFFDVRFDASVPAGSKVWIAAMWYNPRGEFGPASPPQSTHIGSGVANFARAA